MSKPRIADAILQPDEHEDSIDEENNLKRLNNYVKTVSIEKYPPIIQQAIKDIRYISETQREAQQDDLVCLLFLFDLYKFLIFLRKEKAGDSLHL